MPKPKTTNNPARLVRVEDDAKLATLQAELREYQARLPAARERLTAAEQALQAAEQALQAAEQETLLTERRVLAGRATDADLAGVQSRLLDAKRAHAIAATDCEQLTKLVASLPAAIELARQHALAQVAASLRAEYGPAVERLRAALLAAGEASAEVSRLYDAAYREFTGWDVHPRYHSGNIDLGDAGLTTTAAGLVPLAWHEFLSTRYNESRFALWLAEADALLARLPRMAEDDLANREHCENALVLQEQREREKLARLAEMERRNAERFGQLFLHDGRPA